MRTLAIAAVMVFSLTVHGQTKTTCDPTQAPTGWVTVSFGAKCDSFGTRSRTIQKIDGLAPGTTVDICDNDALPPGWAIISYGDSTSKTGWRVIHRCTAQNLSGMPSGSSVTLCGDSPVPIGWVLDSTGGVCAVINGLTFKSRAIRKL